MKVVPSEVVVDKEDETLVLVFDEALGVGDGVSDISWMHILESPFTWQYLAYRKFIVFCKKVSLLIIYQQNCHPGICLFDLFRPLSGNNPELYGSLLTLNELKEFDMLSDDYEINWHLRSVINPTSKDLKSRSAKVKNRRRAFMDKLMYGGKFFSGDSMRDREPYLHHKFVGKFQDQSGRRMYRPGESGHSAIQVSGLKYIIAKHLAQPIQVVSFVHAILPELRRILFLKVPDTRKGLLLSEIERVSQDYKVHRDKIHTKLVQIMREKMLLRSRGLPQIIETWNQIDETDLQPSQFAKSLTKLHKYKEVVQMCEQTLAIADKELSYCHMGKLDKALSMLEKYEQLAPFETTTEEPSLYSAANVHELFQIK
ncbi:vacuolar protein sorting-associated protein 54, chloroplastic isoform X1, partial [Tanacetum coccineum]